MVLYNYHMALKNKYTPGVCNIGPAEIRMRRWSGHLGLAVTLCLLAYYSFNPTDQLMRLWIFIPATVSTLGYLQAYLHFCAHFGLSGLFNVSDDVGRAESVEQKSFRRKDQQKAFLIIIASFAVGVIATTITLVLF